MRSCLALVIASVVLVTPAVSFAEGSPIGAASVDQKAKAQALFLAASAKYESGDMQGALAGFRASYDVVKSPNTGLLISRTLANLGQHAEAYRAAQATEEAAREAAAVDPKYRTAEAGAREDIAELRSKVGFVRVDLAGRTGNLKVAGRSVSPNELANRIAVDPGSIEVVLEGTEPAETKRVEVSARAEETVSFAASDVAPPVEKAKPSEGGVHPFDMGTGQRITGFVFAGLGAVGMGLFAGFGAANQSTFSDLEEACASGSCPASSAEDIEDGKTLQTAANGSVIAGSICLAIGAGLLIPTFVLGDAEKTETSLHVGPGYIGLESSF